MFNNKVIKYNKLVNNNDYLLYIFFDIKYLIKCLGG